MGRHAAVDGDLGPRHAPAGALAYLRRQWYDIGLSNHASAVRSAREVATPDRIVFGSDWPYAALPDEGGDPAPELDELGAAVRARIDAGNAAALVLRLARAHQAG